MLMIGKVTKNSGWDWFVQLSNNMCPITTLFIGHFSINDFALKIVLSEPITFERIVVIMIITIVIVVMINTVIIIIIIIIVAIVIVIAIAIVIVQRIATLFWFNFLTLGRPSYLL